MRYYNKVAIELPFCAFQIKCYAIWEDIKMYINRNIYDTYMANQDESILFITAFKDIGRNKWNHCSRGNQSYFELFLMLAKNINYNLIVFVSDEIQQYLRTIHEFTPNIIFKNLDDTETFSEKYLDQDLLTMSSKKYQSMIPAERKNNPEHLYSAYNFINHSKINFVSASKKMYPDFDFYSWIDFGYVRDERSIPRGIKTSRLPKSIIYHCVINPTKKIEPEDMLKSNDIYITGSSFIVHASMVGVYEELYENKIKEWLKRGITDDDQNLILQLYYDSPDLFHLIQCNTWFSLYNILP